MPKKFSKKRTIFCEYLEVRPPNIAQILGGRTSLFRDRVFSIVKKIPRGKVLTYKEVARLAGSPRAFRAVGNILNKNHNSEIPCHRVVRSDGRAGGYNCGQKTKIELLRKEGVSLKF